MNKVIVTGGAGFIGTSLVQELIDNEYEVVVYDNLSTSHKSNIFKSINKPKLTFICGDMLDPSTLSRAVEGCECVFHLAANPDVRLAVKDTRIDFDQNIVATYNLLEAMRKSSTCKKIIFATSSTVYGEPTLIPTPEHYAASKPISLYGATKLACESIISGYCYMFEIAGIALRFANIVGPNSGHGVIYDFIMKLIGNPKQLQILGNGNQNKSYLFIDDCISAFKVAHELLKERQNDFDVFNVGSDDRMTTLEIAKIVIDQLSLSDVSMTFERRKDGRGWAGDVVEMLLDSSKLKAHGWRIDYTSREAVIHSARGIAYRLQNLIENSVSKGDLKIEARA